MSAVELEEKKVASAKGNIVGPTFKCTSGEGQIHTFRWIPAGPIKSLVFYLHGYLDHVTMPGIIALAETLQADGFAVFAMDDQGHGESDGLRGWFEFENAMEDFFKFINMAKQDFPNLPYYIVGHSMGGLFTTLLGVRLTTDRKDPLFKGGCMLAPGIRYVDVPPAPAVKFLIWLSQCCPTWQCLCIPSPPDNKIYKDVANRERHAKDPLRITVAVRLGFGAWFVSKMNEQDANPQKVSYPFLVIHGDNDLVIDYRGSVDLHKKASTPEADKEIIIYKGAWHDLLTDEVRLQCVPAIKAWLNKRVATH